MIYDSDKDSYTIYISRKDLELAFSNKKQFRKFIKDTFGIDIKELKR